MQNGTKLILFAYYYPLLPTANDSFVPLLFSHYINRASSILFNVNLTLSSVLCILGTTKI